MRYGINKQLSLKRSFNKYFYYYLMLLIPIAYILLFRYIPMGGNIIAFRRYIPGGSIFGQKWVGLMYFKTFFLDSTFWRGLKNTLVLSSLNLTMGFPIPIIFALLLNEITNVKFKKFVQTVSYLPHFLSIVVVVGLLNQLLSPSTGIVNMILESLNMQSRHFLAEPQSFRFIYIISDIWQHTGWNAVIYLAALSNIDVVQYEAADIDGASKVQKIIHVTIPGIMSVVVITLILAVGKMLDVGFEKVLLIYNPLTYETADVISTYVYRVGLNQSNYSYAAAIGLFDAVIGFILITCANLFARKFSETSLW